MFPGMPEAQYIDTTVGNLVAQFVMANEEPAYVSWLEFIQPFPDPRVVQQRIRC